MRPCRQIALALLVALLLAVPAAAHADAMYWGALVKGDAYGLPGEAPTSAAVLDRFESDAGKQITIVNTGQSWASFDPATMDAAIGAGVIPLGLMQRGAGRQGGRIPLSVQALVGVKRKLVLVGPKSLLRRRLAALPRPRGCRRCDQRHLGVGGEHDLAGGRGTERRSDAVLPRRRLRRLGRGGRLQLGPQPAPTRSLGERRRIDSADPRSARRNRPGQAGLRLRERLDRDRRRAVRGRQGPLDPRNARRIPPLATSEQGRRRVHLERRTEWIWQWRRSLGLADRVLAGGRSRLPGGHSERNLPPRPAAPDAADEGAGAVFAEPSAAGRIGPAAAGLRPRAATVGTGADRSDQLRSREARRPARQRDPDGRNHRPRTVAVLRPGPADPGSALRAR